MQVINPCAGFFSRGRCDLVFWNRHFPSYQVTEETWFQFWTAVILTKKSPSWKGGTVHAHEKILMLKTNLTGIVHCLTGDRIDLPFWFVNKKIDRGNHLVDEIICWVKTILLFRLTQMIILGSYFILHKVRKCKVCIQLKKPVSIINLKIYPDNVHLFTKIYRIKNILY